METKVIEGMISFESKEKEIASWTPASSLERREGGRGGGREGRREGGMEGGREGGWREEGREGGMESGRNSTCPHLASSPEVSPLLAGPSLCVPHSQDIAHTCCKHPLTVGRHCH